LSFDSRKERDAFAAFFKAEAAAHRRAGV
jgi:hypothetical protein